MMSKDVLTADLSKSAIPPTRRNRAWLVIQFVLRLVFAVWLRYRAHGIERVARTGGGLLLVNHQSFLDPALVGLPLQRPVSYLARDSLFRIPVIGWILRSVNVIPIRREAASTASIRQAVDRMNDGFLVGIFPEGTRCFDGKTGEFKPGFVSLVRRIDVPVYPVGIAGAYDAMPRHGILRLRPRKVYVVFGEPLCPQQLRTLSRKGQEKSLVEFARQAVLDCQEKAENWRQNTSA